MGDSVDKNRWTVVRAQGWNLIDSATTVRPRAHGRSRRVRRVETGRRQPADSWNTRKPAHAAAWQVSAAILLVLTVATGGLHVLFAQQTWWLLVVFVMATVLAAAAGARALTRVRSVPTVAGAVVLVGMLTLLFAPGTSIVGVIPTLDTVAQFGQRFAAANESIYTQAVPATADPSIVFSLCVGLGIIAIIADLLAITLRLPAVTGLLVLGVLAVPAFTLPDISDPFIFVLTAAAFLFLLVIGSPKRQPRLATAIGAVAIIGTLVLPVVLPAIDTSRATSGEGTSTGVNPVLTLGDDLRRAAARTVISYTTTSGDPHYLRLVSLENFTGDEWAPTQRQIDTGNTMDGFGPVPGLSSEVEVSSELSEIEVGNLTSPYLPMPYPPRSVTGVDDEWYWEPDGFAVTSVDDTARGQEYEVESLVLEPTPEQLLGAGTTVMPELEQYLALPDDLPPVIAETATSVGSAGATNYEKALALQEYFRSSAFDYSEDAPVDGEYDGTGMDIIATFLDAKSGYCVHFASAMAVMSRSLGIPSRVIVGFLPGDRETQDDGSTRFTVTTHDLHSWPELYFDGIGWVQFEPTPGRGAPRAYADTNVAGVPAPAAAGDDVLDPTPSSSAAPSASSGPDAGLDAGGGIQQQSADVGPAPWIALALFGVFLLTLVPAGIRLLQRRRLVDRLQTREASALDAWREVLRTAVDVGRPVVSTETPRETAHTLGISGAPLDRILGATEEKGYAASTITDPRTLVADIAAVRSSLLDAAAPRTRRLARLYPASIWRRITHPLTRDTDSDAVN